MSGSDVSPGEMKRLTNISDSELDAICAGEATTGDAGMEHLAGFVRELAEAFPEMPTTHLEATHVAAMLSAAHLVTEKGESASLPASKAHMPGRRASELPKSWKGRIALKMSAVFAVKGARIAIAAATLLLVLTSVAVAGVLPAPVQNAVADSAKIVGIDLPGGTDELDSGVGGIDQSAQDADVETIQSADDQSDAIEADDQGDQGEQDDEQAGTSDHKAGQEADDADDADDETAVPSRSGGSDDSADESDYSDQESDHQGGSGDTSDSSDDSPESD